MGIRERFFKRKAQESSEIPSGAYEDLLKTRLTTPNSYQDIEGPKTLMEEQPEPEKQIIQQEKPDIRTPQNMSAPEKMKFDPLGLDKRVYSYIQQTAMPAMLEAQKVLYYLQRLMEDDVLDDGGRAGTEFDDNVDYMISLIDEITSYLAQRAASAFTELDEADDVEGIDFDAIEQAWQNEQHDYKDMLKKIGDPFAEPTGNDPFSSPSLPEASAKDYGDVPGVKPEKMTEKQMWDSRRRSREP